MISPASFPMEIADVCFLTISCAKGILMPVNHHSKLNQADRFNYPAIEVGDSRIDFQWSASFSEKIQVVARILDSLC